jgi:hypothetical protein
MIDGGIGGRADGEAVLGMQRGRAWRPEAHPDVIVSMNPSVSRLAGVAVAGLVAVFAYVLCRGFRKR